VPHYNLSDSKHWNESFLSKAFTRISELNKETKGLIGGVYLPFRVYSEIEMHEEFELARNLSIPVGVFLKAKDCSNLNDTKQMPFLKKLKFITCFVNVDENQYAPEENANITLVAGHELKTQILKSSISRKQLQNLQSFWDLPSPDIKAEIFFAINYQSESRRKFQRFWCYIVHILIRNKNYPKVILMPSISQSISKTSSWWKISQSSPGKPETLIEIFDHAIENCTSSCKPCKRLLDCCSGYCEKLYYMNKELRLCVPGNHTDECLFVFNNTDPIIKERISFTMWIAIGVVLLLLLSIMGAIAVYYRVSII